MDMMVVEGLTIEGEPLKRWRIVYWGEIVGHWDKAKDALERYHRHHQDVRPIINKSRKAKRDKPFYEFFDGRKEIDLAALKRAAQAEDKAKASPSPSE
jgi:hypothetical protein